MSHNIRTIQKAEQAVRQGGFDVFGVLPIGPSCTVPKLVEWIDAGMHGDMGWMAREDAVGKRANPAEILPNAQSIILLGFQYTPPPIPDELLNDPSRGIIARYALYDDYHDVVKKKLKVLAESLQQELGAFDWKAYVDTGPFLEREWAERAGLGFVGRNSNLINFNVGSYLFLAEMIVSIDLPEWKGPDNKGARGSCANCRNCIEACPTKAIVADKTIDSNRCISYLTIEHKGVVPEELRPLMKNRIYGCDICQEVCPWNNKKNASDKPDFQIREDLVAPKLETLLFFDDESFRERFRKSPILRAKREGFMRNIAIALSNWGTEEANELLRVIKKNDPSELVRQHAELGMF
ncbi:MAG: tRNA epoxyqueuosine(34) reductase QueG [Candidatus Kerfeldbacteria bacterium]